MTRACLACLACLIAATLASGCRSTRMSLPFGLSGPPGPVVLQPTATAADVVAAVNANTARVQSYQAPSATISMPDTAGLPLVQASLAAERPLRFRLRATTALTGPELDLGSNDERFWVWARRNEPPAVYTARHDLWATSPVRGQVAIEPSWLIEAIGLVTLDPNAAYVGPVPHGDGTLELRTSVNGPSGPQQRVLIVDAQSAWVREQHVYDASGSLSASVFADQFKYDPATQVSLPERVRLNVPSSGLDLTIHTGPITTNAPLSDGGQLWVMPQLDAPLVDLTNQGATAMAPAGPWDLNGVANTYGATGPLATQFGDRSTPSNAASSAWQPRAADPATPAPQPAEGFALPVATPVPTAQPSAAPSGFTGLPTYGRSLD